MKVIIAGGRDFTNKAALREYLHMLCTTGALSSVSEIVSGTASGADKTGEALAADVGLPVKQFPADWKNIDVPNARIKENRYGKYNANAGHDRNGQMRDYGDVLVACWDGKSAGTKDMISKMVAAGKPVHILPY